MGTVSSEATTATAAPGQRFATLVRGRIYIYRDKEFTKGVVVPVTADEETYLYDAAVDAISLEGEAEFEYRRKFQFGDAEWAEKMRARFAAEAGEPSAEERQAPRPSGPRNRSRG